jgi:hypothetical protein
VNGSVGDDLSVIVEAGLMTSRYQDWRAGCGVPVQITIGAPKFWRGAQLVDGRLLAPWGLLDRSIPTDECRRRYVARLDARAVRVVALLARIARQHPGQRLMLLCFERVPEQECHRRWFASWFEQRFGLVVPELPPEGGQFRFPI